MTFKPHTALVTGGGTGIGRGLAEALHKRGTKVIIAGRRQEVLEGVCADNKGMEWVLLDVADPGSITKCRDDLIAKHPELDCVFNNAGMQRMHDFAAEEPVDLHFADKEVGINITGLFMMCAAWLPHLKSKPKASIVNVSSGLAFVPLTRCPAYCATKAAVHSFTQSLRYQLRETAVKIIELEPPAVQTELHDYMGSHGRSIGMPLPDFVTESMQNLDEGLEDFAVENAKNLQGVVDAARFEKAFAMLNSISH